MTHKTDRKRLARSRRLAALARRARSFGDYMEAERYAAAADEQRARCAS